MTVNHNDLETAHPVQLDFLVPVRAGITKLQFVDCLRSQIYDIDKTVWNSPFGSQVVGQPAQPMEQNSLGNEMPQRFSPKLLQDILSFFSSYFFHTNPPGAFSPQDDAKMPEKPSNYSHTTSTYAAPGCEAAPQCEKPKKAGERCFSEPAFTLFSRAAVCHHTSTWEEPSWWWASRTSTSSHTWSSKSYYYDLSDEIHLGWKETVNGRSVIKYWTNSPTTAASVGGTVNNYISMLPTSAFKDNAELRRVGLESRYSIITNQLNDGDAKKALDNIHYRIQEKVETHPNSWITEPIAQGVIEKKNVQPIRIGFGMQPLKGIKSYQITPITTVWELKNTENVYTTGINAPSVTYTSSSWKFSIKSNCPSGASSYVKWDNRIMANNPIIVDRFSVIRFSLKGEQTLNSVHMYFGETYGGTIQTSQTVTQIFANFEYNLFDAWNVRRNKPDLYYQSLRLNFLSVDIMLNNAGTNNIYTLYVKDLYIYRPNWKNDFTSEIPASGQTAPVFFDNWIPSYGQKPIRGSDKDTARFTIPWGMSEMTYRSLDVSASNSFLVCPDTYLYIKLKQKEPTGSMSLTVSFKIATLNGGIIPSTYTKPLLGTPAGYSIFISHDLYNQAISRASVDSSNVAYILITTIELKVKTTEMIIDYIYISYDLNNNGVPDYSDEDIDGDGIGGDMYGGILHPTMYPTEWVYGGFSYNSVENYHICYEIINGDLWMDPFEHSELFPSSLWKFNIDSDNDGIEDIIEEKHIGFDKNDPFKPISAWCMCSHTGEWIESPYTTMLMVNRLKDLGISYLRTDFVMEDFGSDVGGGFRFGYTAQQKEWINKYDFFIKTLRYRGIGVVSVLKIRDGKTINEWGMNMYRDWGYTTLGIYENRHYNVLQPYWKEFCKDIAEKYGNYIYNYQIMNEPNYMIRGLNGDIRFDPLIKPHPDDLWKIIRDCNIGLEQGGEKAGSFETIVNPSAMWDFAGMCAESGYHWSDALEKWCDKLQMNEDNIDYSNDLDILAIDWYPGSTSFDNSGLDWSCLDTLLALSNDRYSKQAAIMETGFSTYDLVLHTDNAQKDWINDALPTIYAKVSDNNKNPLKNKCPLLSYYELYDGNSNEGGGWAGAEGHFGIVTDQGTDKISSETLRSQIGSFKS